jgi:hypothetical protein
MPSESILVEYRLRSFLPWLTSILLDVAVGGDVVQNPAQVIFIISTNHHCIKPTCCHFEFFYPKSGPGVEYDPKYHTFPWDCHRVPSLNHGSTLSLHHTLHVSFHFTTFYHLKKRSHFKSSNDILPQKEVETNETCSYPES